MAKSNEKNRRYRRQTVRILVDYHSEHGAHCDYATTLGAGGLFIACEDPLAVGTILKLHLRLPHGKVLHELEGRVSWNRQIETGARAHTPGMGVAFTDRAAMAPLARELDRLEA